jgi:hypothetical protein
MLRLRSYPLAVAAAVLAVVPWSPAWLLGLPFGIWALVVLCRPGVRAAFLNNRLPAGPAGPVAPGPAAVVAGRILSGFRSFAGYFLPTFAGHKAGAESGIASPNAQDHPAPSPAEEAAAKTPEGPRFGNLRSKLFASLPEAFRSAEPRRKDSPHGRE